MREADRAQDKNMMRLENIEQLVGVTDSLLSSARSSRTRT